MTSRYLFQDPGGRAWISSKIKGGGGTSSSANQSSSYGQSQKKASIRSSGQHGMLHRIKSLDRDVSNEKKDRTGDK